MFFLLTVHTEYARVHTVCAQGVPASTVPHLKNGVTQETNGVTTSYIRYAHRAYANAGPTGIGHMLCFRYQTPLPAL